jgi:hypothetical protein
MQAQNYTPIDDLVRSHSSWGGGKEVEPPRPHTESIKVHESGEHEIVDEEVKQHVELTTEKVEIPPEVKAVGVEETNQPLAFEPIPLPLSDDKVVKGSHAPIYSSLRWLSTLAAYMLSQAHQAVKVVHGKVVRVQT